MSNLKHPHYYYYNNYLIICLWLIYTCCSVEASNEFLSRDPLLGSAKKWPLSTPEWETSGGGVKDNVDLTRLLDVGAQSSWYDSGISYVPPLDGASPVDTLPQDQYAMQLVLFDLELVELKSVDPVGGSFRAELQMVLHWIDSITDGSNGTSLEDDCRFSCATKSQTPLCCDKVWVPPLDLPSCDINKIQSSTPTPYIYTWFGEKNHSYSDCFKKENEGLCTWRRLWYLNIDATCGSNMDFHNFPFDVQLLNIDILNPYASRTWFQLTKGFLKTNIGENINTLNLSPDAKILGWQVKDLTVSETCGTSKNWKQTFLTQDSLLKALNYTYVSQKDDIIKALDSKDLTCTRMDDVNNGTDDIDFLSLAHYALYQRVKQKYLERVDITLKTYKECSSNNGKIYYWNLSSYNETDIIPMSDFGNFDTSSENIMKSFNILDLHKENTTAHVSFRCAISAIANLTTPGIQVTIVVQRYRLFYVVKLLIPTIACVAFSFAAFGFHPKSLVGRLSVVIPSAIALTALQGFVVSTDIPPVAYLAPSTNIILLSYIVQIILSFESIFVNRLYMKSNDQRERGHTLSGGTVPNAPSMNAFSNQPCQMLTLEESRRNSDLVQNTTQTNDQSIELVSRNLDHQTSSIARHETQSNDVDILVNNSNEGSSAEARLEQGVPSRCFTCSINDAYKVDRCFKYFLIISYFVAVAFCVIDPLLSEVLKKQASKVHVVHLWAKD